MKNKDNDTLQRFIFESTDIRGEITTLSSSYLDLLALQKYPPQVELLFGEFLAAASLLSSSLKHRGMITVQANGSGPITAIMAECSQDNKLRGIVRGDFDNLGDLSTLQELLGKATLAITLEPEGRERYQGVVPLDEDNLSKCLEFYFYQSEQLPTKIKLASNSEIARGLFIQQLPPSSGDREESLEDWQRVSTLFETLSSDEQLQLSHNDQLYRLFHEQELRLFDAKSMQFSCSCSRQRTENALLSLGRTEVMELSREQGLIMIHCQFCSQEYRISAADVSQLFDPPKPLLH
ncbi:Hsp33 family molecular chaperone HslO [Porticoccaceae bacterium]|nr:Hsp33 family molecular chaperone HslO [Porticoccaceae bacterium]